MSGDRYRYRVHLANDAANYESFATRDFAVEAAKKKAKAKNVFYEVRDYGQVPSSYLGFAHLGAFIWAAHIKGGYE